MHFGISEGKEGIKHGSRPWLGMDIFWNCPICPVTLNFPYLIFVISPERALPFW